MKHLQATADQWREFAEAKPDVAQAWAEALVENESRNQTALERELTQARRTDGLRHAGVPERLREALAGIVEVEDTPARKAAINAQSHRPILLMCGSPGCGKTFGAVSVMADALGAGLVVGGLFVKAFELSRLSIFSAEDKARLAAISRTRFLVLDDLGAEMLHDGLRPMLDELIDARYQSGGRTILTTNLDPEAFKARYGARIADRLREVGRVVVCGNESMRRAKGSP